MVFEGVMGNLSELISALPVEVADKVFELVLVLKAVGFAAIIYIIYTIIMGIFTYRRIKKVDHIENKADLIKRKVNAIDKKLDKLLSQKG